MNNQQKKGFTLIELLIVIGILAILATTTILVLNPAQLFAQARDAQRISDLATLRSAITLYLSTVSSPSLGTSTNCYVNIAAGLTSFCAGRHMDETAYNVSRKTDGLGWIPIDFNSMPGGSPLSILPIDPKNNTSYFYSYAFNNTDKTFELNANMESTRYAQGGGDDVESTDGGPSVTNNIYEVGNDPGLDL